MTAMTIRELKALLDTAPEDCLDLAVQIDVHATKHTAYKGELHGGEIVNFDGIAGDSGDRLVLYGGKPSLPHTRT